MEHYHTELLNYIAKKIGATNYLEIGVFNPTHNFDKVDVMFKAGVDPDPKALATVCQTSDDFFENFPFLRFDLIWIDGLHHADQVKKDIKNAWKQLNPGGVIVIHDSNPHSEKITCVPRGSQREWTGDVWKTIIQITSPKFTVNEDYGCCVIRKEDGLEFDNTIVSWETFDKERESLLNLVSAEKAKEIIDNW